LIISLFFLQINLDVNKWFKNKAWNQLTEKDIRKVYDDLEEGKIKNSKGQLFKDRQSYYNKIFKSKLFELAGKKELAKKVIEYTKLEDSDVRFIEIETFRKIVDVILQPKQKLLAWLAFDIGENIDSLLKLQKRDFVRQINPDTKEAEYIVNLPKEKLKRSRTARSEITNFKETVELVDIVLSRKKKVIKNGEEIESPLEDDDLVFPFGYRQAEKVLDRAVKITDARCIPKGQRVTWKDMRSSMACYLLKEGWTTDEVKARLGHKPSSKAIDRYVNYLAIGRHKQKVKLYKSNLHKIESELEESKNRETLLNRRLERLREEQSSAAEKIAKLEESDKIVAGKLDKLHNALKRKPHIARQLVKDKEIAGIFT
jgi:hypothetical protein